MMPAKMCVDDDHASQTVAASRSEWRSSDLLRLVSFMPPLREPGVEGPIRTDWERYVSRLGRSWRPARRRAETVKTWIMEVASESEEAEGEVWARDCKDWKTWGRSWRRIVGGGMLEGRGSLGISGGW
jgi:hypothetical protein